MIAGRRQLPGRLVLLGHPVAHSLSPVFQNAALAAAGLRIRYDALDVAPDALAATLELLRREDAAGNVTVPHKRAVALACAHVTPLAARVGAVNTFWFEGDALVGDNTDVGGFAASVDELLASGGRDWPGHITLLGAGGAARAVIVAAQARGVVRIDVHARNAAASAALASEFPGVRSARGRPAGDAALVVNATPVGMSGEALPLPVDAVPAGAAVVDLVYRRGETAWVRECRAAGHPAIDGLPMLIAQGALAFERFTGRTADAAVMRASLDAG